MSIRLTCPNCGRGLKAAAAAAGKSLSCPKCSATIVVPGGPSAARREATEHRMDEAEFSPSRAGRDRDDALDMTPMVDVTFLLLIFFMVTAAFALQKAIDFGSQEDDAAALSRAPDDERDAITVRIDRENIFWIGRPDWPTEREAASVQEMFVQLRLARDQDVGGATGPARMIVMAHGSATHERVVAALDAGAEVGAQDVRLISQEDDDL